MPHPSVFPVHRPDVVDVVPDGELRLTWFGQSSFLVQIGTTKILLDPVLSKRASPFQNMGPARINALPMTVADLPRIDAVVQSHDHYDHLDEPTVRALIERFGDALHFHAPLEHASWYKRLGAHATDYDWWQSGSINSDIELTCTPAQHWTRRGRRINTRLWSSFMIRAKNAPSLYFAGDSGYCPAFQEIKAELGAPDIALIPIGAYEPRWFMKTAHMNPEEAVQTFVDLGAKHFVGMHWGTFRLTDEPMLEPPRKVRAEWSRLALPPASLHVPAHGETLSFR